MSSVPNVDVFNYKEYINNLSLSFLIRDIIGDDLQNTLNMPNNLEEQILDKIPREVYELVYAIDTEIHLKVINRY